ncbi:MAG: transposase [Cyanobacteria bacterium RYN_339]|nr:transposase [Cyanobacteria bacterium RYN_339]
MQLLERPYPRIKLDDGRKLTDAEWAAIAPHLPTGKPHPLGCHNPRVSDRLMLDVILLLFRTGTSWNTLNKLGPVSSSAAHGRFLEWERAGVFRAIAALGLLDQGAFEGVDRRRLLR